MPSIACDDASTHGKFIRSVLARRLLCVKVQVTGQKQAEQILCEPRVIVFLLYLFK